MLEEGIYIGMDEDEYHALPMLSAHGMLNILVSPVDFWARSWMNPEKEQECDSEALLIGRAYHKRILEGKQAFYDSYCESFVPSEDCLKTVDDMKRFLTEYGISFKASGKKDYFIDLIQENANEKPIYDIEKALYDQKTNGKIQLSPKLIHKIEIASAMIEFHPDLSKCFKGGLPEVTVIWKQEFSFQLPDGTVKTIIIWFKARLDYLKPAVISDLKTFTNLSRQTVEKALYKAMSGQKYHIQACHYLDAGDKASQFAAEGKIFILDGSKISQQWIDLLAKTKERAFGFIFQQKGIAPLARGKWFRKGMMMDCARASINQAMEIYAQNMERFGNEQWVDLTPMDDFEDDQFMPWATDI